MTSPSKPSPVRACKGNVHTTRAPAAVRANAPVPCECRAVRLMVDPTGRLVVGLVGPGHRPAR